MHDRLYDQFPAVVWAQAWPDLGPTLVLFKPILAFELSQCQPPSSELMNPTRQVGER